MENTPLKRIENQLTRNFWASIALIALLVLAFFIIGFNPVHTLNKKEMCLNSVQYEIGAYEIILDDNQNIVEGVYTGSFKDLYDREFAFECELNTQEFKVENKY